MSSINPCTDILTGLDCNWFYYFLFTTLAGLVGFTSISTQAAFHRWKMYRKMRKYWKMTMQPEIKPKSGEPPTTPMLFRMWAEGQWGDYEAYKRTLKNVNTLESWAQPIWDVLCGGFFFGITYCLCSGIYYGVLSIDGGDGKTPTALYAVAMIAFTLEWLMVAYMDLWVYSENYFKKVVGMIIHAIAFIMNTILLAVSIWLAVYTSGLVSEFWVISILAFLYGIGMFLRFIYNLVYFGVMVLAVVREEDLTSLLADRLSKKK